MKKYIKGILLFLILFGIDQWTKNAATIYLKGQETKKVLGDFFVLRYLKNYGAAFGILQNKQIFLILLTAVILVMILYVYIKTPDTPHYRLIRIFSIMLAAGAMGNMYDRFAHRYVIDFLYAKVIDFPIFNVADCYVVVSAVVLAMLIGFYYQERIWRSTNLAGKKKKKAVVCNITGNNEKKSVYIFAVNDEEENDRRTI